jgi:hypothetical protein
MNVTPRPASTAAMTLSKAFVLLDEIGRSCIGLEHLERTQVMIRIFLSATDDDGLTRNVTQKHLAQPRKTVFPAHGQTHLERRKILDRQSLEVGRRERCGDRDIQSAVSQTVQHPHALVLELDADVRMRPRE